MILLPRRIVSVAALALAAPLALFNTGCGKKTASQPAPFTAELTEIAGVQAVYTLRHPKLINADLEKLMTAVPEAALARMFLGQLAAYGYPEFSDIEPGSNLGVALLDDGDATMLSGQPTFVGFAKLKPGGKIATALGAAGLVLEQRGEWTWIARDAAAFAKVTAPDAITAHVSRPQTEEIRFWGRLSPALLAELKSRVMGAIETQLAEQSAADRQALVGYAEVAWSYLAQIHSAGGALDLNDQGIALTYSAQFLPDTALGVFLRHAPGADPEINRSVPADGLFNLLVRTNPAAQTELFNGVFAALLAVDHPEGRQALTSMQPGFIALIEAGKRGTVATFDMDMPVADRAPEIDLFMVSEGDYQRETVNDYYRQSAALTDRFSNALLSGIASLAPAGTAPQTTIKTEFNGEQTTIAGVPFGAITSTTATDGLPPVVSTQYYGVSDGLFIMGSDPESLAARLPAVLARQAVANPVQIPLGPDDLLVAEISGRRIVDMVVESSGGNLDDPDLKAQVQTLKDGYAAVAPPRMTVTASQAKMGFALTLPYPFLAQSARLGQFAMMLKQSQQQQ
ncbi:MAG: hypothetical protein ABII82_04015 [Verrucomicrobiota bacterium]